MVGDPVEDIHEVKRKAKMRLNETIKMDLNFTLPSKDMTIFKRTTMQYDHKACPTSSEKA